MTPTLAMEYIPRRMRDLGYGDNYYIRFVHFRILPLEVRIIDASTDFYILVEDHPYISVDSDTGIFNTRLTTINEYQYEHNGQMVITNPTGAFSSIHFIQVIPKNNTLQEHGDK